MQFGPYRKNPASLADLQKRFGSQYQPPRRYRDSTINAGTLGVWDFASTYGAPGGYVPAPTMPQGTTARNLVEGGVDAVRDTPFGGMAYADGKVSMTGDAALLLQPIPWKAGLMLTAWSKSSGITAGGNTRSLRIGPVFIIPDPSNFQVYGPGQAIGGLSSALAGAVSDNLWHQWSLQSEDMGGGNHRLIVALDRTVFFEGPTVAASAGGDGEAVIGARGAAGTIIGPWARARLDDTSVSGYTGDEIRAFDYERNITRISNL